MTTSGLSPEGRRFANVVGKSASDLTPEDFVYLRKEDPELAEQRSREYSAWWASRSEKPAVAPATTPKAALFTDAEKAAFRGLFKSIADKSHEGDPLSELDEILGTCGVMTPMPAAAARVVTIYVKTIIEQQREHNKRIEKRIAELEARKTGVKYMGVYRPGLVYEPDEAVTWGGQVFIARERTTAKPGEDGTMARAWQLAVRKGGDGRNCPNCKPTSGNE